MKLNIARATVRLAPNKWEPILIVEADDRMISNFVVSFEVRQAVEKKLGLRAVLLDVRTLRFEGDQDLQNALPKSPGCRPTQLQWAQAEFGDLDPRSNSKT